MKIALLTANLGGFDNVVNSVPQTGLGDDTFLLGYQFNDTNFPPIKGLTSRLQYRIPKLFGWEMFPGYDIYIWLDGSMSLQREDSVKWLLEKLGDKDAAFFTHPWRSTIKEEVDHIEEKLQQGNDYIVSRYKNGLHKQQYALISGDLDYVDNRLYTSTVFIYRDNDKVRSMMESWWFYQSRYFTCDQVVLPYVIDQHELDITVIQENQFKIPYVTLTSKHK